MDKPLKILLLEDSNNDAEIIRRLLQKEMPSCEIRVAKNKPAFITALNEYTPDVILSDNSLPQFDGTEALAMVREKFNHMPFILVTGTVSEEFAADMIKRGADDYVLKDRMIRMPAAIVTALKSRLSEIEKETAAQQLAESEEKYRSLIERVSDGFLSLNIQWEITYANRVADEMLNRKPGYLVGKNIWQEFPEAVDKPFYIAYHQAMKSQRNIRLEDYSSAVNMWVEASIYPSVSGLSIYFRDVTEQRKAEKKARKTEEKYGTFIQRITDAFIAIDKNWCYTYLNKQAGELIRKDPAELIGKNVWTIFPDAVGSSTYDAFTKAMREQHYVTNIDYYAPLDLWQENHIYPSDDGLSIFIRDITVRKRAEIGLLQTQKRFIQAQEIAHLGNWEVNFVTQKSKWSDEAYRIYGLEPDDHNLMISDWMSFIHPEDKEHVKEILDKSAEKFTDSNFDHRIVRRDGTIRHVHSESKFEFDTDGKPIGNYGITLDITDRKLAEQEIRKSNERFKFATQATQDIIWELNFETKQYVVHEGAENLFGGSGALDWKVDVEGKYILEEDRKRVNDSFYAAKKNPTQELWKDEYRVKTVNNTIMTIINHALFIRDKNGKVIRAIGAITDISEKTKLEEELLEQQRQEQLKIVSTALEAQEKERNAIGVELHDNVNQILVGTKLMLSMVETTPEKTTEIVNSCRDNLQDAIDENRKIAHALVGPDLKKKSLVQQLTELFNNMLKPLDVKIVFKHDDFNENLTSQGQKLAIYRIAQEQCTNIVKYAQATQVAIQLSSKTKKIKMSIADNGVGVEESKKTDGIGLRNIHGRLSVFNGDATIKTAPGKGFKLEISIPLTT